MINDVVIGQLTAGVPLTVFALLGQQNFWSRDLIALILLAIVVLNAAVVVRLRRPRSGRYVNDVRHAGLTRDY
jgi:ribose/xylose/arabinose/galactoside ABC-type transport system permease subunit